MEGGNPRHLAALEQETLETRLHIPPCTVTTTPQTHSNLEELAAVQQETL